MIMLYIWLLVMLSFSMLAQIIYRHARTPGYKAAFNLLAFVGVFVHEVAHYTVSIILGAKPGKIRVKYRSEDKTRVAPHGSVENPEFERNSLLQTFAISFAPMLVSTFLFMFCLDVIFNMQTEFLVKVVAMVFGVSLLIGLEPSGQDVKVIGYSFKNDPRYSVYQICLLIFSGVLMWLFVDLYYFVLPFEVLYYVGYFVILTSFYFVIKGVFWIIGKITRGIAKRMGKVQISSPKFFTRRRRFKHIKDPNEREVQW
jgi:hypothetical protein